MGSDGGSSSAGAAQARQQPAGALHVSTIRVAKLIEHHRLLAANARQVALARVSDALTKVTVQLLRHGGSLSYLHYVWRYSLDGSQGSAVVNRHGPSDELGGARGGLPILGARPQTADRGVASE